MEAAKVLQLRKRWVLRTSYTGSGKRMGSYNGSVKRLGTYTGVGGAKVTL